MAPQFIIGIDEVGRGPIAGPLCVGACMIQQKDRRVFSNVVRGIRDSKQLSPQKREQWNRVLFGAQEQGICIVRTVMVSEKVIDTKGLTFALRFAIKRVLHLLKVDPRACEVLLDGGIKAPLVFLFQKTIIKGDEKIPLIGAASIVAKVRRDRYMVQVSKRYPQYGFERHKGYGTREHYMALRKQGISKVHRRSFLKKLITNNV